MKIFYRQLSLTVDVCFIFSYPLLTKISFIRKASPINYKKKKKKKKIERNLRVNSNSLMWIECAYIPNYTTGLLRK